MDISETILALLGYIVLIGAVFFLIVGSLLNKEREYIDASEVSCNNCGVDTWVACQDTHGLLVKCNNCGHLVEIDYVNQCTVDHSLI